MCSAAHPVGSIVCRIAAVLTVTVVSFAVMSVVLMRSIDEQQPLLHPPYGSTDCTTPVYDA